MNKMRAHRCDAARVRERLLSELAEVLLERALPRSKGQGVTTKHQMARGCPAHDLALPRRLLARERKGGRTGECRGDGGSRGVPRGSRD